MSFDSRSRGAFWSTLGALCVAATLALTPAGVQIARAGDPPPLVAEAVGPSSVDPTLAAGAGQSADSPICRAGEPAAAVEQRQRALLRQQMLRVQQEIARRAARESGSAASAEDVVVLNGRGYRYGN